MFTLVRTLFDLWFLPAKKRKKEPKGGNRKKRFKKKSWWSLQIKRQFYIRSFQFKFSLLFLIQCGV